MAVDTAELAGSLGLRLLNRLLKLDLLFFTCAAAPGACDAAPELEPNMRDVTLAGDPHSLTLTLLLNVCAPPGALPAGVPGTAAAAAAEAPDGRSSDITPDLKDETEPSGALPALDIAAPDSDCTCGDDEPRTPMKNSRPPGSGTWEREEELGMEGRPLAGVVEPGRLGVGVGEAISCFSPFTSSTDSGRVLTCERKVRRV